MSIGETLAQARRWAGLTVTEVSQRTRIRETLVRDIERDDYSGCGGDFYTRGHIRAIARAVGADPEPLIEEYDAARRPPSVEPEAEAPHQFTLGRPRGWQRQESPGPPGGYEPHGGQQRQEPLRAPAADTPRQAPSAGWPRQDPPTKPVAQVPQQVTPAGPGERITPADSDVRIMPGRSGEQTTPAGWPRQDPPTEPVPQVPQHVTPAGPGERITPADPVVRITSGGWGEQAAPASEGERVSPADSDVRITSGGWGERATPAGQGERTTPAGPGEQVPLAGPGGQIPPAGARHWQDPPEEPAASIPYQYGPGAYGPATYGPAATSRRHQRNWPVLFGLVLLVTLGFLGYYFVSGTGRTTSGTPTAGSQGASAGPGRSPQAGGGAAHHAHTVVVHLTAIHASSVVFTTPGGKYLFRATIPAGKSKKWTFRHPVTMRLGNPSGVKLSVDGKNPLPRSSAAQQVTLSLTPGHPAVVATPAETPTPAGTPSPAVPLSTSAPLTPVSAAAFGVSGVGQGDNSQLAHLAIDRRRSTAWNTDWYTSAHFGNLYPGTGLLIDMGRPVTITSAQIWLGSAPGANFQLRVGSAPALAGLDPVARASGASGVVRLQPTTPARGRYVLIWFTKLPVNSNGNFEASVYNVRLEGRA